MKEEFILPNKWCIELNNDNIDLIQKWRKETFNYDGDISKCKYIYYDGLVDVLGRAGRWRFFLSTEQFIQYVLKESPLQSIPIIENYDYLITVLHKLNIR